MIALTRRYAFPASHVLSRADFSAEENERVYGKCANPNGHGHNYGLEVTVAGPVDPESGQILARERLDALVREALLERFSHRRLNDDPAFADRVPTAENLARVAHEALAPAVAREGPARLLRVRVVETARNAFEYGGAP